MDFFLNKKAYTVPVSPDETAVEVIRERCNLTGTKLVCGAGVCGACTVLVDGVPMVSCLLPAVALEGCVVQTIEGAHGRNGGLHPVQKAFMACDALQCGFCTPGFINEGIAFYDKWRKEHGTAVPTRDDIAAAMAGHLCRCGAYVGILEAIQTACAGKYDEDDVEAPRVDALEKVTGRARYTVDMKYDGQLEGKLLRSPHAHAKVKSIDPSAALAMPGVKAVIEILDKHRTVRYVGQEVAAVAAIDARTAEAALEKIKVVYEILPAVIGMAAAQAEGAPQVYPGLAKDAPSHGEGVLIPGAWHGNIRRPIVNVTARKPGKAQKLINSARKSGEGQLVEGTWRTEAQVHASLEPHACVACWDDPDHLTVHASTQACHLLAQEIAEHFDLPHKNVQVMARYVGGGFGSKLRMRGEHIAAIGLSKAAGAPVRVVFDRAEEMSFTGYRPAADMQIALLADENGKLKALSAQVYSDGGVSVGSQIATLMGLIYGDAPRALEDYDVVNHMPPGTPFRGPGGPLACWSLEQAVDEMAYRLNVSPTDLRRRWDTHPQRQKLYDWADSLPAWRERGPVGGDKGRFRRGLGLAAANWFYFYHADTHVEVRSSPEGLIAQTAAQDMGNGSRTVIATAVAEVFGLLLSAIDVRLGDSQAVRGPLSGGSRTTNSVYTPAYKAAVLVREQLVQAAAKQFGWTNVTAVAGGINHTGGLMSWAEVFKIIPPQTAIARRGKDKGLPAMPLALGADDITTGKGFTGALHVCEVEVDTRLGKIRPLRAWCGLAVGRIFVPVLARSQCYGAVIQGLGYALYEARQVDMATGRILSYGLEDYRIPGIGDVPEIEIHFIEEGFAHAEGKGVGLSELATLPVAASVGNAVFHATGWRPYELPVRLVKGLSTR